MNTYLVSALYKNRRTTYLHEYIVMALTEKEAIEKVYEVTKSQLTKPKIIMEKKIDLSNPYQLC